MEQILIDTDIVIDFLRGYQERIKDFFQKVERGEIKVFLSPVSVVELYFGIQNENKQKIISLENLISFIKIVPLEKETAKTAGLLKRKYNLGLADSIITATSLENQLPLFTFNAKHFKKIKELNLY